MAIQDFTAGQVLTAAQMDSLQANDYNWTVSNKTASYTLAATDKGTRVVMNSASATTITVNTSIFAAGDTLYLQNINSGCSYVTLSFDNFDNKAEFMQMFGYNPDDLFIKGEQFVNRLNENS